MFSFLCRFRKGKQPPRPDLHLSNAAAPSGGEKPLKNPFPTKCWKTKGTVLILWLALKLLCDSFYDYVYIVEQTSHAKLKSQSQPLGWDGRKHAGKLVLLLFSVGGGRGGGKNISCGWIFRLQLFICFSAAITDSHLTLRCWSSGLASQWEKFRRKVVKI